MLRQSLKGLSIGGRTIDANALLERAEQFAALALKQDEGWALLDIVFVAPTWQRRGLASALVEIAEASRLHLGIEEAAVAVQTQSTAQRDAVSGVNLDEEAAQLIRYQQAYSANAKIVSLSSELFEDLLSAIR